jgi:dipeptidyl aminopeptidase/acylaminoacyl peptidase
MEQQRAIRESTDTFPSGGDAVTVERFEPPAAGRHPAVLFLHGADGLERRGETYRQMARQFAGHGYAVFLVHYLGRARSAYGGLFANPLQCLGWLRTVRDALTYVTRQPGVDARRIGAVGISLGAYLATTLGTQDARLRAVVDCFGGLPDPFAYGLTRMPPVLILHGANDPVVPVREAYKLERLLRDKELPYEMWIYPGGGHVLEGEDLVDAVQRTLAFLDKYLSTRHPEALAG